MRQKHLESALSVVQREFPNPNVSHNHASWISLLVVVHITGLSHSFWKHSQIRLEQYPTSPTLTASVVLMALSHDDVGPGRSVLDLGCGTGMLLMGCALVDSDVVMGVDCDGEALAVAAQNAAELELENTFLVQAAVPRTKQPAKQQHRGRNGSKQRKGRVSAKAHHISETKADPTAAAASNPQQFPLRRKCVDTVVTNPPFGTKHNAGMDVQFLRTALQVATRAVYSFHKSSTREYLLRTVPDMAAVASCTVVAQMKFDIPQVYKFHKEKSVDIDVDLIRVELQSPDSVSAGVEENRNDDADGK